ncbi:C5a anaphylatoxin chemotactic receptor 1-like [Clytia hemisphaerica]|uniref:C5a anaphylatoxin chemotactic receptor 1-like n=1 Tax=Clytia hemisphaerica TaxID=252671 RepID=UPI0034D49775
MDNFRIISLCLSIIGILVHVAGIVLLVTEHKKNWQRSKGILLLINLSVSDILFSLQNIVRCFLQHFEIGDVISRSAIMDIITYAIGIPFYFGMFLLTMQRFLEVYFHMRYYRCWFQRKQYLFCVTTWFTGVVFAIPLLVLYVKKTVSIATIKQACRILSMILTLIVILEFILVYSYIFNKFRAVRYTRERHITKRPRIYIPFLIVATFIIFISIPDFLSVFFQQSLPKFLFLFYYINVIVDALIYIALKPTTRGRLRRSMERLSIYRINQTNISQNENSILRNSKEMETESTGL